MVKSYMPIVDRETIRLIEQAVAAERERAREECDLLRMERDTWQKAYEATCRLFDGAATAERERWAKEFLDFKAEQSRDILAERTAERERCLRCVNRFNIPGHSVVGTVLANIYDAIRKGE